MIASSEESTRVASNSFLRSRSNIGGGKFIGLGATPLSCNWRGSFFAFVGEKCIRHYRSLWRRRGGFSPMPAFLANIFGVDNAGAIHGALLTAWSAAAVAGPVIITELSDRAKAALAPGASRIHIYDAPLRVLAVMLAVGFILTTLVRPLSRA